MPTIKKLRTHQILLRDRQVSIRKELIRLERILKQLSDRDEVSVLERMKVMTAELVDTNAQISDITEMIQKKNSRKRYEFEEPSKTPGNRSRLKNKSGKVHPINGRHVTSSTFSGVVQGGIVGGGKKR